jgi:hypothetical protein
MAEETIREELAAGRLKRLPLKEGSEVEAHLVLGFASEFPGRDVARLAEIIRSHTVGACPGRKARRKPRR